MDRRSGARIISDGIQQGTVAQALLTLAVAHIKVMIGQAKTAQAIKARESVGSIRTGGPTPH